MSESQKIVLMSFPDPNLQYFFSHQSLCISAANSERPHIHDCYEIYVNVTGDVAFLVNNSLYPVEKGDALITRPGDVHICVYQGNAEHTCFCLWLQCPEDSPLISFAKKADFSSLIRFPDDTKKELLRLLYRLKDAEESKREPARTAYLFRILTLFCEREQTELQHDTLPPQMQTVLNYINEHFTQLHCVEDIVKATHISGSTLNRWFRAYLKLSPHKYLEALKLSNAQRLLLEGKSVTEASGRSGFGDCSRFIAIFKNKFGQTPLQYQKHHI